MFFKAVVNNYSYNEEKQSQSVSNFPAALSLLTQMRDDEIANHTKDYNTEAWIDPDTSLESYLNDCMAETEFTILVIFL